MTFLYPEILWALFALIIPVIIHLFKLRRFKKVAFSNVRLLRSITREKRSTSKIKNWILLLTRLLIFTAIILAFAFPYLKSDENAYARGPELMIFYVDNSFSLSAEGQEGDLLEMVKTDIIELVNSQKGDVKFSLLTNDFKDSDYFLKDAAEIKQELASVDFSAEQRNNIEIYERFKSLDHENAKLYWFSDFQRSSEIPKFDSTSSISFISYEAQVSENIAIDSIFLLNPFPQLNSDAALKVYVRNYGQKEVEDINLELKLNGTTAAISNFNIKADQNKEVQIEFRYKEDGFNLAELRIEDYPITYDDVFYFAVDVGSQRNILHLGEGQPGKFIQKAFNTEELLNYNFSDLNELNIDEIKSSDLVILDAPENLSSGISQTLSDYISGGGNLLIIPSVNQNNQAINDLLGSVGLPALGDLQESENLRISFKEKEFADDIYENLNEDIALPSVKKYYSYPLYSGTKIKTILELNNGDLFLGRSSVANGHVFLLSSALNNSWNALVEDALFLPLMFKMAFYRSSGIPNYIVLGEKEFISINNYTNKSEEDLLSMTGESTEMIPAQRQVQGSLRIYFDNISPKPGHYMLKKGRENSETFGAIGMNLGREESNLQYYSQDQLKQMSDSLNFNLLNATGTSVMKEVNDLEKGKALFKWFLAASLCLIIIEIVLIKYWRS